MAFKLVVLLRKAEQGDNQTSGDKTSHDSQINFLKGLPGAERVAVGTVTGSPQGDVPLSRMIEVYFKDKASGQAALTSSDVRSQAQKLFKGLGKAKLFYVDEE